MKTDKQTYLSVDISAGRNLLSLIIIIPADKSRGQIFSCLLNFN